MRKIEWWFFRRKRWSNVPGRIVFLLFLMVAIRGNAQTDTTVLIGDSEKEVVLEENEGNTGTNDIQSTQLDADADGSMAGQVIPVAPSSIEVIDVANDSGGVLQILWTWSAEVIRPEFFVIERSEAGSEDKWTELSLVFGGSNSYEDNTTVDGVQYFYRVGSIIDGQRSYTKVFGPVSSRDHWFNWSRFNVFVASTVICFFILLFIKFARSGRNLFIRKIAGLQAVEEAIGRATEMGRPILFVPGTGYIEDVATIAALNMLGEISRRIVNYNVRLICPNFEPIVYTVAREIVKETYAAEGRPEYYNPDSVFFLVNNQFAFAAAVDGIMIRQKPATNFFMGYFGAESLIMAETGAMTGAIQLAGTDAISQLPFFITACDYTLIGEELYASSAYLSRNPLLLGTLKGQDYSKLVIILALIVVTIIQLIWPELKVANFFQTGG